MNDQKSKERKSLLASFADEPEIPKPWFNDPEKLIAAALVDDPIRRKALIDGLKELTTIDEQFRSDLQAIIVEQGRGNRGKRLSRPRYIDEWVFSHVNLLLQLDKAKSKEEAFKLTSEYFISNNIRTIGRDSVKKIYSKVKKPKKG